MSPNRDKIIDKVAKLLKKANDPSVGEAEAASYAAKAQEMLAQHAIEMHEVEAADGSTVEAVLGETIIQTYNDVWRKSVANACASLYMCKLLLTKVPVETRTGWKMKPSFVLVGRPSSIAVAKSMIEYLDKTVVRLSKAYSKDQKIRHQFEAGCGIRVANRVMALFAEQMAVKEGVKSNLPAIYNDEFDRAQDWVDQNFGQTQKVNLKANLNTRAAQDGIRQGDKVSLNTQVGGARTEADRFLLS